MAASITKSGVFRPVFCRIFLGSHGHFACPRALTSFSRTVITSSGDSKPRQFSSSQRSHVGTLSQQYGKRRNEITDSEEELDYNIDENKLTDLMKQHRADARVQHISQPGVQFSDFPISEQLISRLNQLGYKEPFDVQSKTLPLTLSGKDVIGRAQTGSGKTLAFSIPIVHKLISSERSTRRNSPRAIVISPTRELSLQIYRSIQELNSNLRCLPVYGGESFFKQQSSISRYGVDVVCATPGRLKDHLERGTLTLDSLEFLCLDEADHLLTPEFLIQIENVLENSPRDKQVMLFSATMPPDIVRITNKYMTEAKLVDLTQTQKAPSSVKHLCMNIPYSYHIDAIAELMNTYKPERCIVFIKTKQMTRKVAWTLQKQGLDAQELHSDLSQSKRQNVLSAFRTGQIDILVATDVAARGLDIPEVDLVIQVEPPANGIDFYIHRSGRTGRAGREGLAIMIHNGKREDWEIISRIEKMVNLEHTNGPDLKQVKQNKLNGVIHRIKNMRDHEVQLTRSMAEELLDDQSVEPGKILAGALSLILRGDGGVQGNSDGRPPRRHEPFSFTEKKFQSRRQPHFHSSPRFDKRDQPRRRRVYDDEDEEW